MHKIGDNILYGAYGVMTVVDIKEDDITGEVKTYYLLREYGKTNSSITFVPFDNEKLILSMQPLLTHDEVISAFEAASTMADVDWIPDSRARGEKYKNILKNQNRTEILTLIRTIHNTGLRRESIGKKNFLADENIMHKAEGILAVEFSIALGISPEEVKALINEKIKGI